MEPLKYLDEVVASSSSVNTLPPKGPLSLVNFISPWSGKFGAFDIFMYSFSNCLIFHKDGYFMIWDEFDRIKQTGKAPFNLNLATIYKSIYACSVDPSK